MEKIIYFKKKKARILSGVGAGVLLCALLVFLIGAAGRIAGRLADQLELGQKYLDELDYEQAFAAFEAALKIDPRSQEAYLGLAETYAAMGDLDRAAATLEEGYEKTGSEEIARRLAEGKNLLAGNSGGETDSDGAGMPDAAENQDLTGTGGAGTWDEAGSQAQAGNSSSDTDSENQGAWAPMPEDHVMDWKDANLEAAMREITGIAEGDIMLSDVWKIWGLDLQNARAKEAFYSGEDYQSIQEEYGIRDISALSELVQLEILNLEYNQISDITALSALTNLRGLYLWYNQISDITALSGLTRLDVLWLNNNQIGDITALSGLANLTELSLGGNQIRDITALSGLTNLKWLYLKDNPIADITPVSFVETLSY